MKKISHGFSIIELMVVLGIAGIMVSLAAPSMQAYLANQEVQSQSVMIATGINLARSTAVRERTPASVCQTISGAACDAPPRGWADGWLVFIDQDSNGDFDNGTDTIIRTESGAIKGGSGLTVTSALDSFTFSNTGILTPLAGAPIRMVICKPKASSQTVLSIRSTGQVTTQKESPEC